MNTKERDELYRELMNSIGQAVNGVVNSYAQRPVITQNGTGRIDPTQPEHPYNMNYNEADAYIEMRKLNIPLMDDDVYGDERYYTQTIGNVLKWADEHPAKNLPRWKRLPLRDVDYGHSDVPSIMELYKTPEGVGSNGHLYTETVLQYKNWYIPISELESLLPKEE